MNIDIDNIEGQATVKNYIIAFKDSSNSRSPIRMAKKSQVFRDHMTRLIKLQANEQILVQTRIKKLQELGNKYADGFPFNNTPHLRKLNIDNVPILSRMAHAMADALLNIEKSRAGGDRTGNQTGKMTAAPSTAKQVVDYVADFLRKQLQ